MPHLRKNYRDYIIHNETTNGKFVVEDASGNVLGSFCSLTESKKFADALPLMEKIPRDLAQALAPQKYATSRYVLRGEDPDAENNQNWTHRNSYDEPRVDYENSTYTEITKEEAANRIKNGKYTGMYFICPISDDEPGYHDRQRSKLGMTQRMGKDNEAKQVDKIALTLNDSGEVEETVAITYITPRGVPKQSSKDLSIKQLLDYAIKIYLADEVYLGDGDYADRESRTSTLRNGLQRVSYTDKNLVKQTGKELFGQAQFLGSGVGSFPNALVGAMQRDLNRIGCLTIEELFGEGIQYSTWMSSKTAKEVAEKLLSFEFPESQVYDSDGLPQKKLFCDFKENLSNAVRKLRSVKGLGFIDPTTASIYDIVEKSLQLMNKKDRWNDAYAWSNYKYRNRHRGNYSANYLYGDINEIYENIYQEFKSVKNETAELEKDLAQMSTERGRTVSRLKDLRDKGVNSSAFAEEQKTLQRKLREATDIKERIANLMASLSELEVEISEKEDSLSDLAIQDKISYLKDEISSYDDRINYIKSQIEERGNSARDAVTNAMRKYNMNTAEKTESFSQSIGQPLQEKVSKEIAQLLDNIDLDYEYGNSQSFLSDWDNRRGSEESIDWENSSFDEISASEALNLAPSTSLWIKASIPNVIRQMSQFYKSNKYNAQGILDSEQGYDESVATAIDSNDYKIPASEVGLIKLTDNWREESAETLQCVTPGAIGSIIDDIETTRVDEWEDIVVLIQLAAIEVADKIWNVTLADKDQDKLSDREWGRAYNAPYRRYNIQRPAGMKGTVNKITGSQNPINDVDQQDVDRMFAVFADVLGLPLRYAMEVQGYLEFGRRETLSEEANRILSDAKKYFKDEPLQPIKLLVSAIGNLAEVTADSKISDALKAIRRWASPEHNRARERRRLNSIWGPSTEALKKCRADAEMLLDDLKMIKSGADNVKTEMGRAVSSLKDIKEKGANSSVMKEAQDDLQNSLRRLSRLKEQMMELLISISVTEEQIASKEDVVSEKGIEEKIASIKREVAEYTAEYERQKKIIISAEETAKEILKDLVHSGVTGMKSKYNYRAGNLMDMVDNQNNDRED